MSIIFIDKINHNDNVINVCSAKNGNCILIKNYMDILDFSINVKNIIKYNLNKNKKIVFNLSELDYNYVLSFIYKISQGIYTFNKYKSNTKNNEIVFYIPKYNKKREIADIIESANITRNLINEPSNKMTPKIFGEYVKRYYKNNKNVNVKIFDSNAIKKLGLNLIYSLGQHSYNKPYFAILEYKPQKYKKTICIVGKGVTIDTGGYSIKNNGSMNKMYMDKEGACISFGLFNNLVKNKSNNRIICVCPLVENIISNSSLKPSDIIKAYNGQTIEIVNVDAEGRLILADSLSYICKMYKPDHIIDIATLTGTSDKYCNTSFSYFTINEAFSKNIIKFSKKYGEIILRIPPWVEYMKYIKSNIADVKNSGYNCKKGDDLIASLFLMNFIEKKYRNKWIHIDIRMISNNNELNIAEGFGTILQYLKSL
jgi:leucyl aminopeptidase